MSLHHRSRAWLALWQRYGRAFRHAWQHRDRQDSNFYNEQEAEFLPAALSLQESPDSASLRWTARLLVAMVLLTLVWSLVGRIDIVVNASGKVIPSARVKTIAAVEVASVRDILVREGQHVRVGQILMELDATSSDAERDKAADAVAQARLQVARAAAMIRAVQQRQPPQMETVEGVARAQWTSVQQQLEAQYQDFRARLARLDDEIIRYGLALRLATMRAADYKALMSDHSVSQHAWLEKEQARVELQGQLAEARNQRTALLAQTQKEAQDSRLEAEKIIESAQQDRRRAEERSRLLTLTAPVTGTVQQLNMHTVGGVVAAAQPLMQIVPEDGEIEIEAWLENKDVGFVEIGQEVEVKIDAFDYTKYGTVPARVVHVSRDAIQDEKKGLVYSARIVLTRDKLNVDGRSLPLSAGLSVNVGIRTGSRRVIEYVLSPLLRHQKEALHER
ncbi:HlyD family type I secretion periplasmic adaptor subunit [Herbaspirillum huttiense]|uniref:Membrane fusion protein (MFP) family protein n=2 Tax=Herbaspirillum huttiense TaxID=863372 RepID=A0AAJ2H4C0_9BURK|nr:HlyD family type I secretion periplasmic adaptor subunit [Herbaspirillum huttiense]MDR9836439.1 HlyD family type I secretion periplasmic adaptor subunit [Herbaspirillum huttiense]UWE14468.1 HlyD family type I secretion periplasmic adaptor subunit [Herbaspirillum huttiense]